MTANIYRRTGLFVFMKRAFSLQLSKWDLNNWTDKRLKHNLLLQHRKNITPSILLIIAHY